MIQIVALAPLFHGQPGPLDELELCLAPVVVVITLLIYKLVTGRAPRRLGRTLWRQRAPRDRDRR